jgi:uncharacterized protein YcbX
MPPTVARITIFPMKSCDGLLLDVANVLPSSALRHDRQFALVDAEGRFINAKRTPRIHQLRLRIDPVNREFFLPPGADGSEIRGRLDEDGKFLSDTLSEFFSMDVSIVENDETGIPDDLNAAGPTIISTASLQAVADWFDLDLDEVRHRFRANIEIEGVEPFWEDRLFRADTTPQPFRIDRVIFGGVNPCQRCVVPTRDSHTGAVVPSAFAQQFSKRRAETLPNWAASERFDHFYRLSTNTRLLEPGDGQIRIGDPVEIL